MPREFKLPDLGEGIVEAQIIRVLVKEGERIGQDQYLMEVETDKAAVEIPSPFVGVATNIHVREGQTVHVGDVIVTFDDGEAAAPAAPSAPAAVAAPVASEAPSAPPPSAASTAVAAPAQPSRKTTVPAAPAVRRRAREMGIALEAVTATGPGGRVTQEDLDRHTASAPSPAAPAPAPRPAEPAPLRAALGPAKLPAGTDDADNWGPIRHVPLNQIRKTIASQMARSAFTAVHVTHGDEADITELERMRKSVNEATGGEPKLTVMAFLIRAVCLALRSHPILNAVLDEERAEIVYKNYISIGIAVDSQRGLLVPVIREADRMTLRGIADSLRSLADRIRANQFAIEDLRGGTFTITNVGALGGTFNTPIINYPEVAILGVGRSKPVPALREGKLVERLILPLNLSFDHRALDGADAARFTSRIKQYLETPAMFLLD